MKLITDKIITKIIDTISTITALKIVFLIVIIWLILGELTNLDPYPFLFSSTITNYSGFILTIIILISTKTLEMHQKEAEKRDKEHQDQHFKMQDIEERLVNQINKSQDKQNELILQIAKKLDINV